jgi:hypothetical protein
MNHTKPERANGMVQGGGKVGEGAKMSREGSFRRHHLGGRIEGKQGHGKQRSTRTGEGLSSLVGKDRMYLSRVSCLITRGVDGCSKGGSDVSTRHSIKDATQFVGSVEIFHVLGELGDRATVLSATTTMETRQGCRDGKREEERKLG